MAELDLSPEDQARLDRLSELADRNDYYGLLGVSRSADLKTIQASYYDLSRAWHPVSYLFIDKVIDPCMHSSCELLTERSQRW